MRTFQPQMPPQMSAVDQYPQTGMRMPQVDAIRRARSASSAPLYAASEDVMGGTKPAADMAGQATAAMGGMKPMSEGMGTKPMMEGYGTKPAFNDPRLSQFGRKPMMEGQRSPMGAKPMRMGAPSGRGLPGVPGPAPRVREGY
jgi:hypothetical protein